MVEKSVNVDYEDFMLDLEFLQDETFSYSNFMSDVLLDVHSLGFKIFSI